MKNTYSIDSILGRIPGNEGFYAQQDADKQNKERINKQIMDTYGPFMENIIKKLVFFVIIFQ